MVRSIIIFFVSVHFLNCGNESCTVWYPTSGLHRLFGFVLAYRSYFMETEFFQDSHPDISSLMTWELLCILFDLLDQAICARNTGHEAFKLQVSFYARELYNLCRNSETLSLLKPYRISWKGVTLAPQNQNHPSRYILAIRHLVLGCLKVEVFLRIIDNLILLQRLRMTWTDLGITNWTLIGSLAVPFSFGGDPRLLVGLTHFTTRSLTFKEFYFMSTKFQRVHTNYFSFTITFGPMINHKSQNRAFVPYTIQTTYRVLLFKTQRFFEWLLSNLPQMYTSQAS